jgi:hypothetical protein
MPRPLVSTLLAVALLAPVAAPAAPILVDWRDDFRWESRFEWTGLGAVDVFETPVTTDDRPGEPTFFPTLQEPPSDPLVAAGDSFVVTAPPGSVFRTVGLLALTPDAPSEVTLLVDGSALPWEEAWRTGGYEYRFSYGLPLGPLTTFDLRVDLDGADGDRAQGVLIFSTERNGVFVIPLPATGALMLPAAAAFLAAARRRRRPRGRRGGLRPAP